MNHLGGNYVVFEDQELTLGVDVQSLSTATLSPVNQQPTSIIPTPSPKIAPRTFLFSIKLSSFLNYVILYFFSQVEHCAIINESLNIIWKKKGIQLGLTEDIQLSTWNIPNPNYNIMNKLNKTSPLAFLLFYWALEIIEQIEN